MTKRYEYYGMFTGVTYEIGDDPRVIYKNGKIVDYKKSGVELQNRLDSSLDCMEDGYNELREIEGERFEVYFDGIYEIRRKAYNVTQMVQGGESAYEPGRACDYIIIQDQDGTEIAYAEEIIPEDATEVEADWDQKRVHRLIAKILDQMK